MLPPPPELSTTISGAFGELARDIGPRQDRRLDDNFFEGELPRHEQEQNEQNMLAEACPMGMQASNPPQLPEDVMGYIIGFIPFTYTPIYRPPLREEPQLWMQDASRICRGFLNPARKRRNDIKSHYLEQKAQKLRNERLREKVKLWCTRHETAGRLESLKNIYNETKYISEWDVSEVTDMSCLFRTCTEFNDDISKWNVGKVTDMSFMFTGCHSFNAEIGGWDTSNVVNMSHTFTNCKEFDQDIDAWKVGNVESLNSCFLNCKKFNKSLRSWDVRKVKNMAYCFSGMEDFLGGGIKDWKVGGVHNMFNLFDGTYVSLQRVREVTQGWDMSNVTRGRLY